MATPESRKLIIRLAILIVLIFLVDFFAQKFYLYYFLWWFDMPMHFLGGFWVGLAALYFFTFEDITLKTIISTLFIVLLVGVGWEMFEVSVNKVIIQTSFNTLDSFSDILFDLAGGAFALLYFSKRIMPLAVNKVQ